MGLTLAEVPINIYENVAWMSSYQVEHDSDFESYVRKLTTLDENE